MLEIFDECIEKGVKPPQLMFSIAINSLLNYKKWENATDLILMNADFYEGVGSSHLKNFTNRLIKNVYDSGNVVELGKIINAILSKETFVIEKNTMEASINCLLTSKETFVKETVMLFHD